MNKEIALLSIKKGLDVCMELTFLSEGMGTYTQKDVQEITDDYKAAYEYLKENLK